MAKKTDSINNPIAPTVQPVKVAPKKKPAAKALKVSAVKTAVKKKKPAARATKPKALPYTHADVALRAYFIAEKRRTHGIPGDEHQDWLEAERQLASEGPRAKRLKKA